MHTDVTTTYLGLRLRSPIVVGACPLTLKPEHVREYTIAGAGAVVLPSLLQEQVVRRMLSEGRPTNAEEKRIESSSMEARDNGYNGGIDLYMQTISLLKHLTGIPVIANLNGCSVGAWLDVARMLEDHGADAIEMSLHTDTSDPSQGADAVEQRLLEAVEAVCDAVCVPVSVKLLPFFTSLPNLAWRLAEAGAAGVVLFGREPIWDLREGRMHPTSHWALSDSGQLQTTIAGLVRMRAGGPGFSVAASGGITTSRAVLHTIIAGADVAMVTSELYRTGSDVIAHLLDGISQTLLRDGYESFEQFVIEHRKSTGVHAARPRQIEPMTRCGSGDLYLPATESPVSTTGDRWGHTSTVPLDDSR